MAMIEKSSNFSSKISVFGNWQLPPQALNQVSSAQSQKAGRRGSSYQCFAPEKCVEGLILPLWQPDVSFDEAPWIIVYRALIYGFALAYLLFGVSIVTDRIITAAEVMASQKRKVTVKLKSGSTTTVMKPFWHPVVASLSFGVAGTSSPEILLPFIEVLHRNFQGDELGPSLIVGSGAYHLFVITAICLLSIGDTNPKPIKDLQIFFTTASFAILAYAWVYLILGQFSPGIVELWEALTTFAMFPLLLFCAWVVAKRLPRKLWLKLARHIRARIRQKRGKQGITELGKATTLQVSVLGPLSGDSPGRRSLAPLTEDTVDEEDDDDSDNEKRRKLGALMRRLKKQFPNKSQQEIEEIAQIEMMDETGKSAAFYRLQATKNISGTRNVLALDKMREKWEEHGRTSGPGTSPNGTVQTVGFTATANTCQESCGVTTIKVVRSGAGVLESGLTVDYETKPVTAKAGVNFIPTAGHVTFIAGQTEADIIVTILDDGIYEEVAKVFELHLANPTLVGLQPAVAQLPSSLHHHHQHHQQHQVESPRSSGGKVTKVDLLIPVTRVSILDDDHCGVFSFERQEQTIADNVGTARIRVQRSVGSHGRIAVNYRITGGTAKPGSDYVPEGGKAKGTLHFDHGQAEAFIEVTIIDKHRFGEVYTFFIELLQPRKENAEEVAATLGEPMLGEPKAIQIGICEDEEMEQMLDRLLKMTDLAEYFMSASWRSQIEDAFTVFHEDFDKTTKAQIIQVYLLHFASFPWKLITALLPPARIWHGWLAYMSLLCLMALIAALIGDCARSLGCTIGLKDTVTAITLIPFGMGLPDTFASRRAAMHETTADAAIGQITGSNAVTVFLGMGMAWTIGAAYRMMKGDHFKMPPADFGFSVMLYCTFATACVLVLLLRRLPPIRGELGGPTAVKWLSAIFLLGLWVSFIVLSALDSYCQIGGFM